MRYRLLLLAALLFTFTASAYAQGISFFEGSFAEALARAKEQDKPLFIDFHTSWCGPCKKLSREVFPEPQVGEYFDAHFVSWKVDAEKGEGIDLAKRYKIQAYPSLFFLAPDGSVIYSVVGFRDPAGLIEEGKRVEVYRKYGSQEAMAQILKEGKGDEAFFRDYLSVVPEEQRSEALVAYLLALPDDKLMDPSTASLFEQIKGDPMPLFERIADRLVAEKRITPEYFMSYTFPFQWMLSERISKAIETGDRERLDKMIALKRRLAPIIEVTKDEDLSLEWGRGLLFASEDYLELTFAARHQVDFPTFKPRMEAYMERLMATYSPDTLAQKRAEVVRVIGEQPGAMQLFGTELVSEYGYTSKYIFEWIDYYWRNIPTTPELIARCASWTQYVTALNPYNPQTVDLAARMLYRLGEREQALALVSSTIKTLDGIFKPESPQMLALAILQRDITGKKL